MLATLISTMDISKPLGADGRPIEQELHFSTGLSSHPGHFDVVFNPRSEKAAALLDEYMRA